jgi:hypothetical protein
MVLEIIEDSHSYFTDTDTAFPTIAGSDPQYQLLSNHKIYMLVYCILECKLSIMSYNSASIFPPFWPVYSYGYVSGSSKRLNMDPDPEH